MKMRPTEEDEVRQGVRSLCHLVSLQWERIEKTRVDKVGWKLKLGTAGSCLPIQPLCDHFYQRMPEGQERHLTSLTKKKK